ncbi:hypothetical protein QBC38DRAFT_495997 [Podospora fimiseda]|uniref:Lysyl-tRNA synthetase n=1 Tax=Podospora fimiseda TaxID=252190 RepID=A0AAN7H7U0_9PEZI|nr:hypothetical protein QBC38DRAFT_495997 [Podospora fimiseda]
MRSTSSLQFLRPQHNAWKKPLVGSSSAPKLAVHSRFFHLARQQELEQANALKYPRLQHNAAAPSMRIPDFRAKYDHIQKDTVVEEQVTIRGRIESVRRAGSKLVFLDIKGEFEHVQGLCNLGKLVDGTTVPEFKNLARLLNRGDIISVTGKATRSSTGELSIQATYLPELLTPSLVPQPFQVEETLHRQIELLVNRRATDTLRLRSYIIRYLRDFFHERDFLEFQTPILGGTAGGAIARPFTMTSEAVKKDLSLRIAPELWLKRLVVGGVDRVFELGPAFRNEGIDQTHNPEFTICEFYHAYANLQDLISLTESLFRGVASHCQSLVSSKLTSLPPIDLSQFSSPFQQAEFIPTLESKLGFKLPELSSETAYDDLLSLLSVDSLGKPIPQTLPKLLDRLASIYIEPMSLTKPLFITHHPVCMSPLSKSFLCPKTNQFVSARTELFIGGKELANMYEEENDPISQRAKFVQQLKARELDGQKEGDAQVDESYVYALGSGLPPTGGWGCGVERLVMLFAGSKKISDVMSFGNLRNVVAAGSNGSVEFRIGGQEEVEGKEGEGGEEQK